MLRVFNMKDVLLLNTGQRFFWMSDVCTGCIFYFVIQLTFYI
jgi:hypothetical protein